MVLAITDNDLRTSYIPIGGCIVGVLLSMLAHRFPRPWNAVVGAMVGWFGMLWFVSLNTSWDEVPIMLSVMGSLIGGLLALVLGATVGGIALGFSVAVLIIVLTGEALFTPGMLIEGGGFVLLFCMFGVLASLYRPVSTLIVGSACSGGLMSATCIDIYGKMNFYKLSTMFTIFTTPGVKLYTTCDMTCYYMLAIWGMLALLGTCVQFMTLALVPITKEEDPETTPAASGDIWTAVGGGEEPMSYLKRAQLSSNHLASLASDAEAEGEAKFNYLAPEDMPQPMKALSTTLTQVFSQMQKRFGFQPSSKRNQQEHLLMLITNSILRIDNPELTAQEKEQVAVDKVHAKLFDNYFKWCRHVQRDDTYTGGAKNQQTMRAKIENMSLALLIWGEAATIRHLPEALCFITYCMLKELRTTNQMNREPGSFMDCVIRPLYTEIAADKGDIHLKRRNYDDINEFFWTEKCFEYNYYSGEYSDSVTEESRTLAKALAGAKKTFLETRSWWRVILTFYPLLIFYVVGFHLLVCTAWVLNEVNSRFSSKHRDNIVMVSFVITLAFMLLAREFLSLVVTKGRETSRSERVGTTIRIVVKLGFAVVLCYYYYSVLRCDHSDCAENWIRFLITSSIFLLPVAGQVLAVAFPIIGRAGDAIMMSSGCKWMTNLWFPDYGRMFVGHNIQERDGDYFKYQLFWVLMVTWKMLISYNFQVKPCINPTLWIWAQFEFLSMPMRIIMIGVTWIPFFIVYLFDMYIWYAVWQGVAGLIVGMRNRIGQINKFSIIPYLFQEFPAAMGEKMFQTRRPEVLPDVVVDDNIRGGDLAMERKHHSSYGAVEDQEPAARSRANWHRFAIIWNEMIMDLRRADLLSHDEQFIFQFRWVDLAQRACFQTPLFVSTSSINASLTFVSAKAEQFAALKKEDETAQGTPVAVQQALIEYFSQSTRREAIWELWSLSMGLVRCLVPNDGPSGSHCRKELEEFAKALEDFARDSSDPFSVLLRTIELSRLSTLKPKLLNLVRGARLARSAWKQNRKAKARGGATGAGGSVNVKPTVSLPKTKSYGSMALQDMMQRKHYATSAHRKRYHPDIEKHLVLLKDQLRDLIKASKKLIQVKYEAGRMLADKLDWVNDAVQSAFGGSEEHINQLDDFFLSDMCDTVLNSLYTFLTVSNEFVPKNSSARRRILFFCNSLFMDLPDAPPIEQMHSLTTLTPFYSEDVLYSKAYLQKRTKQGFSVLLYLQTVYPAEWENFCERVGVKDADASIMDWAGDNLQMEVRLWATRRGQTLFRTVDGMMLYEKAISVLAELERVPQIASDLRNTLRGDPFDNQAGEDAKGATARPSPEALACLKYQYVVSAQVYGRQKEELDPKAADIEFLLREFPNLRVAYIDNRKEETKDGRVESKYYSCLIKAAPDPHRYHDSKDHHLGIPGSGDYNGTGGDLKGRAKSAAQMQGEADDEVDEDDQGVKIETVYRIELPGNPIIGEGKPENQNHALIFTRGEIVQAIDMNQEGYFEEAVKMRNLLEEFDRDDSRKHTTIVGFREHIFTGGLSSVANYMAMQEGCFVTLGQRVLHDPLKIRLHYGHPDLFDKLFYITRGGISKASKGINLSEDIFAGFNTVLRGGHVSFKEYIQCGKGRDVGLQQLYKFEGKLSCGNAMQALTRDMYRLCQSLDFLKLLSFFYGGIGFYISTLLAVWGLYAFCYQRVFISAFNLAMPKSFVGLDTVGYWIGTMGVLLTVPIICSIALERGAWKATTKVANMLVSGGPLFFMFHMGTKAHYFARTILSGGAKYRPTGRGFVADHTKFAELYRFYAQSHFSGGVEMVLLLILYGIMDKRVHHYAAVTWCAWAIVLSWLFAPLWLNPMMFEWETVVADAKDFVAWMGRPEGNGSRCWKTWWEEEVGFIDKLPSGSRFFLAVISLRHLAVAACIFHFLGLAPWNPIVLGCAGIMLMIYGFFAISNRRASAAQLCFFRGLRAVYITVTLCLFAILLLVDPPHKAIVRVSLEVFVGLIYLLTAFNTICVSFGYRPAAVQQLSCLFDYTVGLSLLAVVCFLAICVVPAWIQTRLLFHNAFSKGVLIDDLLKGGRNKKGIQETKQVVITRRMGRGRSPMPTSLMSPSAKPPLRPTYASETSSKTGAVGGPGGPAGGGAGDMPVDLSFISKN
mmetsp:Transcript_34852/g.67772  ORF Transcript_34852/g.67772 Transcript_34852/m.67772 type:complete len:2149 (+) Transcript_34852:48-6494(+)